MQFNRLPTAAAAHEFKGLDDWIEVFRSGTHTDSKGRVCSFSEADLDQMASNVDATGVPAVLGHPKHDDRAYGWAREFKREGQSLFVKFSDVDPEFAKAVDGGGYRNRSVSIVKDAAKGWVMRHVGWLGAVPPAITGLKPLTYQAADEADAYEFSAEELWPQAWALGDIAGVFRRLREWLIGAHGQQAADTVVPDYTITSISDQAAALRTAAIADQVEDAAEGEASPAAPATLFQQQQSGATDMPFTQEDLDRARAEAAAAATAAATAQFSAQAEELQRLRSERASERIGAAVHRLVAGGIVTPADKAGLTEFMTAIDGVQAFEFSAADGSKASKAPSEWFAEFMAARKPLVKLGQVVADSSSEGEVVDGTNARAIAQAAQEYQAAEAKAGRTISIDVAVAHVVRKAG